MHARSTLDWWQSNNIFCLHCKWVEARHTCAAESGHHQSTERRRLLRNAPNAQPKALPPIRHSMPTASTPATEVPTTSVSTCNALMLLLLSWWAHQALPTWGADASKRWGIPPGCHCPGTHLIWWWSHQSTVAILLPTMGREEVSKRTDWRHNLSNENSVWSCGC